MKFKKILLTIVCSCGFWVANAQKTYQIIFNESGQIISDLPALVTSKDFLEFSVLGSADSYENRVIKAYDRYLETINNLDKKDAKGNYVVLEQGGFDANNQEAVTYLHGVQAKMADILLKFLNVTSPVNIHAMIGKKRAVDDDITKLTNIAGLSPLPDPKDVIIPGVSELVNPYYVLDYQYNTGPNICPGTISLTANPKECGWIFKAAAAVPMAQSTDHFFKFTFKLRLQNNVYGAINEQLKNLSVLGQTIRGIKIKDEKKKLDDAVKALRDASPDQALLLDWMDSRLKGQEDKAHLPQLTLMFDKKAAGTTFYNSLDNTYNHSFSTSLRHKDVIRYLILTSWINRSLNLTANPITNGLPNDIKGQITSKTQALADSALSLPVVNRKIDLYENMLKPGSQNCCKTTNYDVQLKSYNELLELQKKITKEQAKLTKDIADLKTQASKDSKNQTDYKKSLLSDSLLYAGYFTISIANGKINHPDYHFMRQHNELNDYSHFDQVLQKEINEKQYLEVIAQNHKPDKALSIKFTYTDAGKDVDFLGAQTSLGTSGLAGTDATLEEIYLAYAHLNNLFAPYGNGIISTPLEVIRDDTPDYVSKTNVTPDPDKIPAKGSYAFLDSISAKNLNTQGASFAFRINRLYRFRPKAGLTYSALERRAYTIDPVTNTATYTTTYANLAPSFGIQIFFTPIDIQKSSLFPTHYAPFAYVGYMFNDAPANNFLLGGGWEIISGCAVIGGVHLGKSQKLVTEQGALHSKDYYKADWFVSISFGLEAFTNIFNSAKSISNPLIK